MSNEPSAAPKRSAKWTELNQQQGKALREWDAMPHGTEESYRKITEVVRLQRKIQQAGRGA